MQTFLSNRARLASLLALLMAGAFISESALAHRYYRGGPRVGVYIGAPVFAYPYYRPYYYSPYYYPPVYYPPVSLAPAAPPVYVERPEVQQSVPVQPPTPLYQPESQVQPPQSQSLQSQPQQQQGAMWYYCEDSRAYYPYVKSCPNGWREVTPQPQG